MEYRLIIQTLTPLPHQIRATNCVRHFPKAGTAPRSGRGDCGYALGVYVERVEDISDLKTAISRAIENAPAVVDVVTYQKVVSSDAKKGLGLVPDYQALTAWDDVERARRK